ncbi:MAG: IucA/IucC family protein [Exilibacterium sp.]
MNISATENSRATTPHLFSEKKMDAQDCGLIRKIVHSESFVLAKRRVFRQLLQALIYEKTVQTSTRKIDRACVEFSISGTDTVGNAVVYTCRGKYRPSFGRIRLTKDPLLRTIEGHATEADSLSRFLQEIKPSYACEPEFLQRFCNELEHTLLNHAMSLFYLQGASTNLRDQSYDDIETGLNDAHPYHPCFKSRVGFDISDNIGFGPEFGPLVSLLWLAVRKSASLTVVSHKKALSAFLAQEIGEPLIKQFQKIVEDLGEQFDNYTLLPVHPWQWQNVIIPECLLDLRNNDIVYLGGGDDLYNPQQSIRTLSNKTNRSKAYVKLALSILNTSTKRGLAEQANRRARNSGQRCMSVERKLA